MKLETLLLLAGAVGAGYLYAKRRAAQGPVSLMPTPVTPAQAVAAVTPIARMVTAVPEEGAEFFQDYPYYPRSASYPVWGGSWGGGWGGRGGRRWRRR